MTKVTEQCYPNPSQWLRFLEFDSSKCPQFHSFFKLVCVGLLCSTMDLIKLFEDVRVTLGVDRRFWEKPAQRLTSVFQFCFRTKAEVSVKRTHIAVGGSAATLCFAIFSGDKGVIGFQALNSPLCPTAPAPFFPPAFYALVVQPVDQDLKEEERTQVSQLIYAPAPPVM